MELEALREEIMQADRELAAAFTKRMQAVKGVAEYKKARGIEIVDKEQEQAVLDNGKAAIEDEDLRTFFVPFLQSTMEISKNWQRHLMDGQRVAYCVGMDPRDYAAARKIFPDGALIQYQNYDKTYNAVVNGECDVAVIPFEKSFQGEIGHVLDLMYSGNLYINDSYSLDNGDSITRYAVLSRVENQVLNSEGTRCFFVMFTVNDSPGSLAKAISAIGDYGFNMRIMRSRPMKDLPWHYYFYAEAEGDDTSEKGQAMMAALKEACASVKVLGRYNA